MNEYPPPPVLPQSTYYTPDRDCPEGLERRHKECSNLHRAGARLEGWNVGGNGVERYGEGGVKI